MIKVNSKLMNNCTYFPNTKCDCIKGTCKMRDLFNKEIEDTKIIEELETPLKKFFQYMKENNYWLGNDLINKYRELIQEEKKLLKKLEAGGAQSERV